MQLEQIFYTLTTAVYLLLSVSTLQRLLSGWWRRYYLLTLLLVLNIFIIVPYFSSLVSYGNWALASAQKLYWLLAFLSQSTVFVLVLQLTYRVRRDLPSQAALVRLLTLTAMLAATVSVVFHSGNPRNLFMSLVTRDLTFIAAVINMILWRFLMQVKKKDYLLLAVSAGLGIQNSGDAIGHSIRIFSRQMAQPGALHEFGNVLMSVCSVITILIWHIAFSRAKLNPADPLSHTPDRPARNDFNAAARLDAGN